MSRAPEVAPPRRLLPLVLLVGALLALVLPPLLMAGGDPLSGAVTALALALVALVTLGLHGIGIRRVAGAMPRSEDAPALVLAGRVTDPTHHPVRPRAPGPA